jgi:hypothetical protein
MTVRIVIRLGGEIVKTFTYTSGGNLPVPEVGETLANPNLDGSVLTVDRRMFEYGQDSFRITLDCSS